MLTRLVVNNYAIIEEVDINFSEKLNVITGETGAGKSILLGALALVLGERADTKSLNNQSKKCVVEAAFSVANYKLKNFFSTNDLDYEPETLIRREISPNGRSRAFINDTPVNLSLLKNLGRQLVNLHSQHETLALSTSEFQLNVLDLLAGNSNLVNRFRENFKSFKNEEKRLINLKEKIKIF